MESYVLKRTKGRLEGGKETRQKVIVEVLLDDEEVSTFELNQQLLSSETIHCIIESDCSSDEEFDFGMVDNENDISHPFENASAYIARDTNNYTEIDLEHNEPCSSMAENAVRRAQKPSRTIVIDEDIELVESEIEIVNLLSDDSDDDNINFETYSNHEEDEPTLNVHHPIVNDEKDLKKDGLARKETHETTNKKPVQKCKPEITVGDGKHKHTMKYERKESWCCVIDELVDSRIRLSKRPLRSMIPRARKSEIVLQGRPFPNNDSPRPYSELLSKIRERDYTTFPWLTVCFKQKKIFCWPCSTVYWHFKIFNPDVISDFGKNILVIHSRDSNHKHAENHYANWLKDLAQNKIPSFDFLYPPRVNSSIHILQRYDQRNGEHTIKQNASTTTAGLTTDDECGTLSAIITKLPPLPSLLSLLGQPTPCHDLKSEPYNKNEYMTFPQHHIFNSMGIPGMCKYYMDDEGVVICIVVKDRHVEIANLYDLAQDSNTNMVNNDDDFSKSSEARKYTMADLLHNNFYNGSWTHEQRLEIMRSGGPCPKVVNSIPMGRGRLSFLIHKGGHWLVASETDDGVVCWPCLLFGKVWIIRNNCYSYIIDRHAATKDHLKSCMVYYNWAHANIGTILKSNFELTHGLLRCLVDVICSIQMRINRGPLSDCYIFKLLRGVASQNMKLKQQLHIISKDRCNMRGEGNSGASNVEALLSPLTNTIIKSTETCMRKRIEYELYCTNFVCLILSRVQDRSLVSVVLRYVTQEGDIVERFVKFLRIKPCTSEHKLVEEVYRIMQVYECGKKLVGYTLDGVVMKLTEMGHFDCTMTYLYPTAKLFHYRANDLRTTLLSFLSELTYIKVFCHQMNDLLRFLRHGEDVLDALKNIDGDVEKMLADSLYGLIVNVKDHYPIFVKLLENIVSHPHDWNSETVVQAAQFLEFLKHFRNRFFVATLAWILSTVKPFAECLNEMLDFSDLKKKAFTAISFLRGITLNFACVHELTTKILVPHVELQEADASKDNYKEIYLEITDSAFIFIRHVSRLIVSWSGSECMVYNSLITKKEPCEYEYERLVKTYKGFNWERMVAQLQMVQNMGFFEPLKNDPAIIIKFLREFDLQDTLSEYYALLKLVLTVPMMTVATTTETSATHRAAAYLATNKNLDSTGWIKINSDLLTAMRREKDNFYADVFKNLN